jgi:dihydroorotate dehydrogenase (NAD+) catalytic subunit
MIELAPRHKVGLSLKSPIMPASVSAGYGSEYANLIDWSKWGAFVTSPVTARPRKPAGEPVSIDLGVATLIHTGIPNPGIRAVIGEHRNMWKGMGLPVIVHVAGTTPDDVAECAVRLIVVEGVGGIELGVRDEEDEGAVVALIAAAIEASEAPVFVRLPLEHAVEFAPVCVEAGVEGLVIASPPRGMLPWNGGFVSGRVYGRGGLPLALRAIHETAAIVDVPIIGSGGVHTIEDARAMLDAGATAVQIDTLIWRDPGAAMAIAEAFLPTKDE